MWTRPRRNPSFPGETRHPLDQTCHSEFTHSPFAPVHMSETHPRAIVIPNAVGDLSWVDRDSSLASRQPSSTPRNEHPRMRPTRPTSKNEHPQIRPVRRHHPDRPGLPSLPLRLPARATQSKKSDPGRIRFKLAQDQPPHKPETAPHPSLQRAWHRDSGPLTART
jgi:hypothetical protein